MEYGEDNAVFDPSYHVHSDMVFVTHAHADHSSSLRFASKTKCATEETMSLVQSMGRELLGEVKVVGIGGSTKIGDIEVKTHNSGHILGSVEYEVNTPEGSILYTGDLNCGETYTTRPAEAVSCDILVLETTFGSPMFAFPPRDKISIDVVKWAIRQVTEERRIPAFQTDSIGNAQELISIFNRMTRLNVLTTPAVTKASNVYQRYGHRLEYIDASTAEGQEALKTRDCVLVSPKGSNLTRFGDVEVGFASGWAAIFKRGKKEPFPLSDHADFRQLMAFIRRCSPKRVLTVHGGSYTRDFATHVEKRLGIDASPLTEQLEGLRGRLGSASTRMDACKRMILDIMRIPGFEYSRSWLIRESARKGFSRIEVENVMALLVQEGTVWSAESDRVRLS